MTRNRIGRRLGPAWGVSVMLCLGAGCGGGGAGGPPSDKVARSSLEAALNTWRDGGRPGTLAGVEPVVQVIDTPWLNGQHLASYAILREEPGATEKRFAVRLSLKEPASEQEVRYIVVGRGPVWVYRDEDYIRNMNMEDNPKETKNPAGSGRR